MLSELMSGEFLVFDSLGSCFYEDPLHTTYVVLHKAWGVRARGGCTYIAPKEFVSDGGSLPGIVQPILGNPFSRARPGYLLHDAAYHRLLLCFEPSGKVRLLTKAEADELMFQVALWNGMGKIRMRSVFAGVNLFGGPSWDRYAEAETDVAKLLATHDYVICA